MHITKYHKFFCCSKYYAVIQSFPKTVVLKRFSLRRLWKSLVSRRTGTKNLLKGVHDEIYVLLLDEAAKRNMHHFNVMCELAYFRCLVESWKNL